MKLAPSRSMCQNLFDESSVKTNVRMVSDSWERRSHVRQQCIAGLSTLVAPSSTAFFATLGCGSVPKEKRGNGCSRRYNRLHWFDPQCSATRHRETIPE